MYCVIMVFRVVVGGECVWLVLVGGECVWLMVSVFGWW